MVADKQIETSSENIESHSSAPSENITFESRIDSQNGINIEAVPVDERYLWC